MKELIETVLKQHPFLKEINEFRCIRGYDKSPLYLVGGCVRDILFSAFSGEKRILNDFDFVLKNAALFAGKLADEQNLTLIPMEKYAGKETFRIVKDGIYYDFSEMKGEGITADLRKRDFTINSIAVLFLDFLSGDLKIIDPLNGAGDLKNKVVKVNGDSAFTDDPLRMLRAYRIAGELGFAIDSNTLIQIVKKGKHILKSASERVRYELFKIFELSDSFVQISKNSLIKIIFPELKSMSRCSQNRFHQYDVYRHSLKAYEAMEFVINDYEKLFPEIAAEIGTYLTCSKKALLKLLALFHDVGKPSAKTKDEKGEVHFYRHEKIGAEMIDRISSRLKFSNFERDFLIKGVEYHLRPFNFITGRSSKAVIRFFRSLRDDSAGILLFTIADRIAKEKRGIYEKAVYIESGTVKPFLMRYFKEIKPLMELPKLVNGNDIMKRFALSPSPLVGKILAKTHEAQLSKEIKTKEEAYKLAEKILHEIAKKP